METVSVAGIKDYGSELSSIANKLSSLASQVEDNLNSIQNSINRLLNELNESDASGVRIEDKSNELFVLGNVSRQQASNVRYYKEIWDIRVENNYVDEALNKLREVQENIDLLNLSGNDLLNMSEMIDNFISSIESQLGTNYNAYGNLKDFFSSLKDNPVWIEYKDTAAKAAELKKNDLMYQKYRSSNGEDDYVDYLLDEMGNHRMNSANSSTKYGYWFMNQHPGYGMTADAAFCAAGVTYAMENSGNSEVINPFISVSDGANDAKNLSNNGIGQWHDISDTTYQPQRGDIFYKSGDHTGIVLDSDQNYVYTIESNTSSDFGERGFVNTRVRVKSGDDAYISSGGYYTPNCYINYSSNDSNIILNEDYLMKKLYIQNSNNE